MIMSHSIHSVIRSHCPKTVLSVFIEYMVLWYLTLAGSMRIQLIFLNNGEACYRDKLYYDHLH